MSLRYLLLPLLVDQPSRKRRQVLPSDAFPQLAPLTKSVLSSLDVPGLQAKYGVPPRTDGAREQVCGLCILTGSELQGQ
jgi:hypothetical protein